MAQRLFIEDLARYMDGVVEEADDRMNSRIRDIKSYFAVRRLTVGVKPSFAVNLVHMNLPEEILNHHTIVTMQSKAVDMIILANDMYSYNVE